MRAKKVRTTPLGQCDKGCETRVEVDWGTVGFLVFVLVLAVAVLLGGPIYNHFEQVARLQQVQDCADRGGRMEYKDTWTTSRRTIELCVVTIYTTTSTSGITYSFSNGGSK